LRERETEGRKGVVEEGDQRQKTIRNIKDKRLGKREEEQKRSRRQKKILQTTTVRLRER